jgi:hypothetical protein
MKRQSKAYLLVLYGLAEVDTVYFVITVYYPDQQMHNIYINKIIYIF